MKNRIGPKLFLTLVISLGIIIVIALMNWRNVYNEIITEFGGNYARNHILWQKERIKGVIERDLILAKGFAHSEVVKDWLMDEEDEESKNSMEKYIENYRRLFTSKTIYLASENKKNYYYIDDENKTGLSAPLKVLKEGRPEDAWYFVTLADQRGFTLNVDFDKEVGKTNLWVNVPVKTGDHIHGVAGTGYDIGRFIDEFVNVPRKGIESFILLSDGAIFASKEDVLMNYRIVAKDESKLNKIYHLIPENEREMLKVRMEEAVRQPDSVMLANTLFKEKSHIAAFSYIPTVNWVVFSAIDITDVYSLKDLVVPILFLLITIVIVFLLLGFVLEKMILKPVRELTDGAIRIENGDYGIDFRCFQKDEMGRLKDIFMRMAKEIKHNIDFLEQKVHERTLELSESRKKITTLLNSSGEGFLKFGEDFRVDDEYSKICLKIFGGEIKGERIDEVLFPDDDERMNSFRNILEGIFQRDKKFLKEIMLDLLPSKVTINERNYRLKFHLDNGSSIVLIMEDITDQTKLAERFDSERKQLLFVVEYIKDEIGMKELIDEFKGFLLHIDEYDIKSLYRKLHTFKGNFLQKGFLNIPEALHEVESEIQTALRKEMDKPDVDYSDMNECLDKDLKLINEYLEKDVQRDVWVKVSLRKIKSLEEKLRRVDWELYKEISLFTKSSLKTYFMGFERTVERLSNKENKKIEYGVICPEDILVYLPDYYSVLSVFYHLITNAVIHGVELPEKRLASGKYERGSISVILSLKENWIRILVKDDGKGVDMSYFRKLGKDIGDDNYDFLFENDITSAGEITKYSGRGAGLGAVKSEVEKAGGTVEMKSVENEGTEIIVKLPYKE